LKVVNGEKERPAGLSPTTLRRPLHRQEERILLMAPKTMSALIKKKER
jgi:hypothetical protein